MQTVLVKAQDVKFCDTFMLAGAVASVARAEPYPGERTRIWYLISGVKSVMVLPLIVPDDFELEITR